MGGKMSAAWWRAYRARRRAQGRTVAYNRPSRAKAIALGPHRIVRFPKPRGPLPPLFPHLGWSDFPLIDRRRELAMDLEQERALAVLEGRDPDDAVTRYAAREAAWMASTVTIHDGVT